jgi:hypothetical protein
MQRAEEKYNDGTYTQAQYDAYVQDRTNKMQESLDGVKDYQKENGEHVLKNELPVEAAIYAESHGIKYDDMTTASKYTVDENPVAYEKAQQLYANQYGNCSNAFTSFFATINAKIVKVCPAVATIEASVLKSIDSLYDMVRDKIRGQDVESKYQSSTVTDIANSIKGFSEEHLAKLEEAKDAQAILRDMVDDEHVGESVVDKEDTAKSTERQDQKTSSESSIVFS